MEAENKQMLDFVRRVAMSNTVYREYARQLLKKLGHDVVP